MQLRGQIFSFPGQSFGKVQNRALFSSGVLCDSVVFFYPLCLFSCGKQLRSLTLRCSTLRMFTVNMIIIIFYLWRVSCALGILLSPHCIYFNFKWSVIHFRTNSLGFTPEFLGRVKLVTSVASLLGVGIYNGFLKNVPLRKIFLATTLLGSTLGMTQVNCIIQLNVYIFNVRWLF